MNENIATYPIRVIIPSYVAVKPRTERYGVVQSIIVAARKGTVNGCRPYVHNHGRDKRKIARVKLLSGRLISVIFDDCEILP